MLDRYFVYMLQSASRHVLYLGFTNFLIARVIEHRTREYPNSFSAKYRTWRLVYYEEFGDSETAHDRERQLKGWSRAKKEALIVKMNPRWRDLSVEWEEKYGLEFRLDGRIVARNTPPKIKTKILRLRSPALEKARGNPPALRMVGFIDISVRH